LTLTEIFSVSWFASILNFWCAIFQKPLLKSPYCKKQKWSIQPPPGNELKAKLYDTPIFQKVDRTQRGRGRNFAHFFRSLKLGQKWMDCNSFSSFPKSHWNWACVKISAQSDDRLLKYRAPKFLLTSAENRPKIGLKLTFFKKIFKICPICPKTHPMS
jgi:hypothetical protein